MYAPLSLVNSKSASHVVSHNQATQLALNTLGIPCYHEFTLIANHQDCAARSVAPDAKYSDKEATFTRNNFDKLLGSYGAVSDFLAVGFAADLIGFYPEVKVVLVERDIEKWYRGYDKAIIKNTWSPFIRFIGWLDPEYVGPLKDLVDRCTRGWMEAHSLKEMRRRQG